MRNVGALHGIFEGNNAPSNCVIFFFSPILLLFNICEKSGLKLPHCLQLLRRDTSEEKFVLSELDQDLPADLPEVHP